MGKYGTVIVQGSKQVISLTSFFLSRFLFTSWKVSEITKDVIKVQKISNIKCAMINKVNIGYTTCSEARKDTSDPLST